MASLANLVDHSVLEEDDTNFFLPTSDWKIDMQGYPVLHVERTDTNEAQIVREGKYEGHPVIHTVGWDEEVDFDLFKLVDPEF